MSVKTSLTKNLQVPDAPNLKTFLKNAKAAYEKEHQIPQREPGRPVERNNVYDAIGKIYGELRTNGPGEITVSKTGEISQRSLVKEIKKNPSCQHLSEDTIKKYVKTWRILWKDPLQLKHEEIKWMAKYNPEALRKMIIAVELVVEGINKDGISLPEGLKAILRECQQNNPHLFESPYAKGSPNNPHPAPIADKKQAALEQRGQLMNLFHSVFQLKKSPKN